MDGRTDSAEHFTQADFQTVLIFAQNNGLSRYTFWSVNWGRQCNPVNNNDVTSSECSGVAQNSWDFTTYTVAFAKNAPVTQPSPLSVAPMNSCPDPLAVASAEHCPERPDRELSLAPPDVLAELNHRATSMDDERQ